MKRMPGYEKSGALFVLTAIIFVFLAVGVVSFLAPALQSYARQEKEAYLEAVIRAIAESGIHATLAALKSGQPPEKEITREVGEGYFVADLASPSPGRWNIKSQGFLKKNKTVCVYIEAEVAKDGEKFVIVRWTEGKKHGRNQK